MKNKDIKKGKESTIGKIIYGFLLFMPLIAILSSILISTFNMSAKQEAEIHYKYETNEVNTIDDLVPNNIYKLDIVSMPADDEPLYVSSIYIFQNNELVNSFTDGTSDFLTIFKSNSNFISIGSDYGAEGDYTIPFITFLTNQGFIFYIVNDSLNEVSDYCVRSQSLPISISDYLPIESVETHNLDTQEVFYNAIEKTEQSNLFNWSKTTIIYTGVANTCTQLGITNTFTPMLLTYWLLITVIYILYDIILMILIILHNRIHRLQDSMS